MIIVWEVVGGHYLGLMLVFQVLMLVKVGFMNGVYLMGEGATDDLGSPRELLSRLHTDIHSNHVGGSEI